MRSVRLDQPRLNHAKPATRFFLVRSAVITATAMLAMTSGCDQLSAESSGGGSTAQGLWGVWNLDGPTVDDSLKVVQATTATAIKDVNDARAELGLEPVELDGDLIGAARAHADFIELHDAYYSEHLVSPHVQVKSLSGYLGETATERVKRSGFAGLPAGEVIGYQGTPAATVSAFMHSLYHRLPLISDSVDCIGIGESVDGLERTHVIEMGQSKPELGTDTRIAYPGPGALVDPSWAGRESPQPVLEGKAGDMYPSGPVITLSTSRGALTNITASVSDSNSLYAAVTILTSANDRYLAPGQVAVIPNRPLLHDMEYRVTIRGKQAGVDFTEQWTFQTETEQCDINDVGACGAGRGCYPFNGQYLCKWEGAVKAGGTCAATNHCAPGLACRNDTCSDICDLDGAAPELPSCATLCANGASRQSNAFAYAVCK